MRIAVVCLLGAWLLGCSGGGHHKGGDEDAAVLSADSGTGLHECVDEDGDGFGKQCDMGRDCNDDDPTITDLCFRCKDPNDPAMGCPCTPGTDSLTCKPDPMRVTRMGVTGTLVCTEGVRWCRDAVWSDCEFLQLYTTFTPDSQ